MPEKPTLPPDLRESQRAAVELICEITRRSYKPPKHFTALFGDVVALYNGRWPTHEACQVGYHNLDHALDVALAVARMAAGWNKVHRKQPLSADIFCVGIAAALFHDAGYIKEKNDEEGRGGKYTFSHVKRSADLARCYLRDKGWSARAVELAPLMISVTDFHKEPSLTGIFDTYLEEVMARMVATADLVAQMADVDYLNRIKDLYDEFKEGYDAEASENLAAKGIQVFSSVQEILDGTFVFYEEFVLPRLQALGRMDGYLTAFFGDGRNPYQENIVSNLSSQFMDDRGHWQRLGEILKNLGVVTAGQLDKALNRQRLENSGAGKAVDGSLSAISKNLLAWLNQDVSGRYLGNILMDMGVIDPAILCRGLLAQMLPPALLDKMTAAEVFFLLRVSMLLHNSRQGPWVIEGILEMTNEHLGCEASSILLIDKEAGEMVVAMPAGLKKDFLRKKRIPIDKGLSSWVCRHQTPARVENVRLDERFYETIDENVGFQTTSLLAVPLHVNGQLAGVIELLNKIDGAFTEHDIDILTVLANAIGSALGIIFRYK